MSAFMHFSMICCLTTNEPLHALEGASGSAALDTTKVFDNLDSWPGFTSQRATFQGAFGSLFHV